MVAEFIGCDGSMGLRHGEYYDITITKDSRYVWVRWHPKTLLEAASQVLEAKPCRCAYSNEAKLSENWKILLYSWSIFK